MAPSGRRADNYPYERARVAPDRGRPERHLGRGLGGRWGRRDRGVPGEACRLPHVSRVPRRLGTCKGASPPPRPGSLTLPGMKLSYLWRGLPGHPVHPPLTDATIGAYTFATVAAFIQVVGITSHAGAYGWWLALV